MHLNRLASSRTVRRFALAALLLATGMGSSVLALVGQGIEVDPTVQPEPEGEVSTSFKYEVTVPAVETEESNVSGDTIREIFEGRGAGHAADLAALNARSIHIPEVRVKFTFVDADGRSGDSETVYRDLELKGVVNGVAQVFSLESAVTTGNAGLTTEFGRMSASQFDLGLLLEFYGLVKGEPTPALRTMYRDLVWDGAALTFPQGRCRTGRVTQAEFKARPLNSSFSELMGLLQQLGKKEPKPEPETIGKLIGFYVDLFGAVESSPMEFGGIDCSATDLEGRPASFSLASIVIGALKPGYYPEIRLKDMKLMAADASSSIAEFVFKGFDYAGPLEMLQAVEGQFDEAWLEANARQLIPAFRGVSFSDLKIDAPSQEYGRIKASVGAFDLGLGAYVNGIPTDIASSASHVALDVPTASQDESIARLRALGFDHIDIGYELAAAWDPAAGEIRVKTLSFNGVDMGAVAAAGLFGNATADLFDSDTLTAMTAALGLTVKRVELSLDDAGLGTKALQMTAAEQGTDVARLTANLSGVAQGTILSVLGGSAEVKALSDAVGAFIEGGKSLLVVVEAKDKAGIGLGELNGIQENPAAFVDKVTIDATTKDPP